MEKALKALEALKVERDQLKDEIEELKKPAGEYTMISGIIPPPHAHIHTPFLRDLRISFISSFILLYVHDVLDSALYFSVSPDIVS